MTQTRLGPYGQLDELFSLAARLPSREELYERLIELNHAVLRTLACRDVLRLADAVAGYGYAGMVLDMIPWHTLSDEDLLEYCDRLSRYDKDHQRLAKQIVRSFSDEQVERFAEHIFAWGMKACEDGGYRGGSIMLYRVWPTMGKRVREVDLCLWLHSAIEYKDHGQGVLLSFYLERYASPVRKVLPQVVVENLGHFLMLAHGSLADGKPFEPELLLHIIKDKVSPTSYRRVVTAYREVVARTCKAHRKTLENLVKEQNARPRRRG